MNKTSKTKPKQISIRFSIEEYDKLISLAKLQYMTPTQYLKYSGLLRMRPVVIKDTRKAFELQNENDKLKNNINSLSEAFRDAFKGFQDKYSINTNDFINVFKNTLKMKINDIDTQQLFLNVLDEVLNSKNDDLNAKSEAIQNALSVFHELQKKRKNL